MKVFYIIIAFLMTFGCFAQENEHSNFDPNSLKPLIVEASTTWGKAIKQKDISLLAGLYDEKAHYLPNDANAIHGQKAILQYWKASFDFMTDLNLHMETLEGTRALLYETGTGSAYIRSEDGEIVALPFKYVNVWKRQIDGSYRVVIDTFNQLATE